MSNQFEIAANEKYWKLQITCPEYVNEFPHCSHGPTLLFCMANNEGKIKKKFFACAAFRERKLCQFYVPAEDLKPSLKINPTVRIALFEEYRNARKKVKNAISGTLNYCHTCNVPFKTEHQNHTKHEIERNLSPELIKSPTKFLRPLNEDKAQAQYFFDDKALKFFENCCRALKIRKVVCIGAPRLHEHLCAIKENYEISSFLLDFDHRFYYFYDDDQFAWHNMCNNYFFDPSQKEHFLNFLHSDSNGLERVLLFTDPPFGCRTEPIANTLRQISKLYSEVNTLPYQPLSIFWIFPYFSEHYIKNEMPALEMCEYKVNYINHLSYTDAGTKSRKLGSPVRVFTNIPLEDIRLPVEEEYKYCTICRRYTALENRHCKKCGNCTSKNGATYRHCNLCGICVKPTYDHCLKCRRCTNLNGHDCIEYQNNQRCWICRQVGHIEFNCELLKRMLMKSTVINGASIIKCLLCGQKGHNELKCLQRDKYLEESTFMGETVTKIKIL